MHMLTELHIQNFAIIDQLALEFGPGLVILTGETGAGKSIIMDALDVLMGSRADVSVIRSEAELAARRRHLQALRPRTPGCPRNPQTGRTAG